MNLIPSGFPAPEPFLEVGIVDSLRSILCRRLLFDFTISLKKNNRGNYGILQDFYTFFTENIVETTWFCSNDIENDKGTRTATYRPLFTS
jgi:hypothetical protein